MLDHHDRFDLSTGSAGVLVGLTLLVVLAAQPERAVAATQGPEGQAWEMLGLMNREREGLGLPPLAMEPVVYEAAVSRAMDMATSGYFSHVSPSGRDLVGVLAEYGIGYSMAGENIARGNYGADAMVGVVHGALMGSEGHRANILDPHYHRAGVGIAEADGEWYFAIIFVD